VGEEGSLFLFLSHDQERQHPSSEVADMYFHITLSNITVSHEVMHKSIEQLGFRTAEFLADSWRVNETG